MKTVCTMPVRNEEWILGLTARAALMWCDALVVFNHGSTDASHDILSEIVKEDPSRVVVVRSSFAESAWNEMEHRQCLLDIARVLDATHIAMLDADELVTDPLQMRELSDDLPTACMLELPQINCRGSIHTMHATGVWAEQHTPIVFKDNPRLGWYAAGDGYQHHQRAPHGKRFRSYRPVKREDGGLMHLQMVDERRLCAKQLLYCLNDLLRWPGRKTPDQVRRQYSLAVYGYEPETSLEGNSLGWQITQVANVPAAWWEPYRHLLPYLRPDAEPWQLAECRRIVCQNPGIMKGLDSFGVEL